MHPVAAAAASQTAPLRPAPATCCRDDIAAGMFKADPPSRQGLVASYSFLPENVEKSADGKVGGWASAVAAALVQHAVLCCAWQGLSRLAGAASVCRRRLLNMCSPAPHLSLNAG